MFEISEKQIKMFDSLALERDVSVISSRLREEHPEESALIEQDERDLEKFVMNANDESRECGVRSMRGVEVFAEARLLFGSGFHEDESQRPELVSLLRDENVEEGEKVEAISEELALYSVFV